MNTAIIITAIICLTVLSLDIVSETAGLIREHIKNKNNKED